MILSELLRSDGFLTINRSLAHEIGLNETIIFQDLLGKYAYFEDTEQLENGYFFNTAYNIEKDTTLSEYQQRKALKVLTDLGLISCVKRGIPSKRYFKITASSERILSLVESGKLKQQNVKNVYDQTRRNLAPRREETSQQDVKKLNANKNNNDIKNENKGYTDKDSKEDVNLNTNLSTNKDLNLSNDTINSKEKELNISKDQDKFNKKDRSAGKAQLGRTAGIVHNLWITLFKEKTGVKYISEFQSKYGLSSKIKSLISEIGEDRLKELINAYFNLNGDWEQKNRGYKFSLFASRINELNANTKKEIKIISVCENCGELKSVINSNIHPLCGGKITKKEI